jgi:predicted amidohydrolase
MTLEQEFRLAAIQAAPIFLNRDASTEKACQLIEEAGQKGVDLAAFGESWLPGYPWWMWEGRWYGIASGPQIEEARLAYLDSGVEIPSTTTHRLCQAAGDSGIDVVIGIAERDSRTRGTMYGTLLFVGREGKILGRHRKLKPTYIERTIWGEGDGSGLRPYARPYGRISGLNCAEHQMMLPGYALVAQGTQIHVAAWPTGSGIAVLSQAFAKQGCCYVLSVGAASTEKDFPEGLSQLQTPEWYGQVPSSRIFGPWGSILAEAPTVDEETIITTDVTLEEVASAKRSFDIAGHYSRPDVLQLHVNRLPLASLVESDSADRSATTADAAREHSAHDHTPEDDNTG